jgi:hypothetical protein
VRLRTAKVALAMIASALTLVGGPLAHGQQPRQATSGTSAYIPLSDGPAPDEVNRRALESRAGNDAGKILLRSTPTSARVTIDGLFVGKTPLLLIVAPGKYKIQMQNERQALAERSVELGAKETQEVALTLAPKYPDRVTTH